MHQCSYVNLVFYTPTQTRKTKICNYLVIMGLKHVGWFIMGMCWLVPRAAVGRVVRNDTVAPDDLAFLPGQDYSEIVLVYFRVENCSIQEPYPIKQAANLLPSLDSSKPTVFYFHGFTESVASESVNVVAEAFCELGSYNFVLGDWGKYAKPPYLSAYYNVRGVGREIGLALNTLVDADSGLPCDTLWLIGHSLGAHVAGIVSDTATFTIPRITGLDPAGPGFIPPNSYLTAKSADVVDVIHTDALFLGYSCNDGTVDFWPNGGSRPQPGCGLGETSIDDALVACSHARSWAYLASSVLNETAFPAVLCPSWHDFQKGACPPDSTNVVYMGYPLPGANATGSAYLITGAKYPYGLGPAGTQPAS